MAEKRSRAQILQEMHRKHFDSDVLIGETRRCGTVYKCSVHCHHRTFQGFGGTASVANQRALGRALRSIEKIDAVA